MSHEFCRSFLRETIADVKRDLPDLKPSQFHPWKMSSLDAAECRGPEDFCWHGRACCRWEAKAHGIEAYHAAKTSRP